MKKKNIDPKSNCLPAEMQLEICNYKPVYDQDDPDRVVDYAPVSEATVLAQQIYVRTSRIEYGIHFTRDDSLVIVGPDGDYIFLAKIVIHNGTTTLTIDPPPYVLLSREDDNDAPITAG